MPGVMLYFDTQCLFENMDSEDGMALILAMINYAKSGEEPELEGIPQCVWPMLASKIDRDRQNYEETREKRKYAAFVKQCNRDGVEPMTFYQWQRSHGSNSSPYAYT